MPEPLAAAPAVITAGSTVRWYQAVADSDFAPGGSYSLVVYLTGASVRTLTATNDSGRWLVTLPAAGASGSGGLTPGGYQWHAYAETGSGDAIARELVASGRVSVLANPVSAVAQQTHAEKVLAAIEAVIENRATADVQSYTIGGRSLTKMTPEQLLHWRNVYRAEVRKERAGGRSPSVQFAFGRPS